MPQPGGQRSRAPAPAGAGSAPGGSRPAGAGGAQGGGTERTGLSAASSERFGTAGQRSPEKITRNEKEKRGVTNVREERIRGGP